LEGKILGAVRVVIQQEIRVVENIRERPGMRPVGGADAGVSRADVNAGRLAGEEPSAFGLADEVGESTAGVPMVSGRALKFCTSPSIYDAPPPDPVWSSVPVKGLNLKAISSW
jgi:hypothetical protein